MKYILFHILTALLLPFLCSAQNNLSYKNIDVSKLNEPEVYGEIITSQTVTLGSQFYFNTWQNGTIAFTSGKEAKNVSINYNGYIDELIWLNPSLKTVIVQKEGVKRFYSYSQTTSSLVEFEKKVIKVPYYANPKETFLHVLCRGEVNLYAFRQIVITGKEINQEGSRAIELPVVSAKPIYYIETKNNSFVPLHKINRRSVLKIFPNEKEAIKRVLSEKKIRIKTENDLIRAIDTINDLLTNNPPVFP